MVLEVGKRNCPECGDFVSHDLDGPTEEDNYGEESYP